LGREVFLGIGEFWITVAREQRYPYQKMIKKVLDYYVSHYKSA